ncbi:MAG: Methionine-tRNA ligase [Candidatus Roizmanbacteria bacterium GW2011_GWC2_37_13]|uniref:Methionine-tRNA ligase n=1 Tax=Candidatus Roizmanbacteria bacterium GW2011_GWC2_37_13 TaxID=1618486 RepID=A0A0G0G982_9BACT|nr:MAG: Methionine-tRNA ligase [Candidatus Roizmanbacteria bacterium GW2011_GWC1_37_12]KKQ26572.1 MAG: Methionine-tRNA ligase [Candidatus Roizmanbacteria bacterium GW2011_GWC2_37_13]
MFYYRVLMKKLNISFLDFDKLDLRVGEVKKAILVENSKHLIKLVIDLGEDYGTVEILSGLAPTYAPEDLKGNKYIVLANLEPKKMAGSSSNGMILVADEPEKFLLLPLDKNLKNGTVIR